MLNVAFAGVWHVHFKGYANSINNREECKITAIWDNNEQAGKEAAELFGCDFVENYDDLLLRDDVDAVAVTSSTNLHTEIIIKAANAKKHIFTEKVLCFTMEEALKIKAAIENNKIKFCIPFFWRSKAEFLWVKKAVDSKMLGEITYCRMRNAHNGRSANWLPETFYDKETCGGGAMIDLGAHPMYLLNWLMGKPKAISSVFTNVLVKTVEDNAVSVLEYENGAIGVSETAFVAENNPFSLEITGTKGTIYAGGHSGELVYNIGDGWIIADIDEPAKSPIDFFVNDLLYNTGNPYSIDDAVALTETMEAAYKSYNLKARVLL